VSYGNIVDELTTHFDTISCLIFLSGSSRLFSSSWDCCLKSYSCLDGSLDKATEKIILDHDNKIVCFDISVDEKSLITADIQGMQQSLC